MAYITRIHIEQCRNVRQLDIDLSVPSEENGASRPGAARPAFRHLILTGPNGSGKSGVLEEVYKQADEQLFPDLAAEVSLEKAKEEFQRRYVLDALELHRGNRTRTARALGVDPRTIFRYLEKEQKPIPSDAGGGDDIGEGPEAPIVPLEKAREEFARRYVLDALDRHHGNRTRTARALGVEPRTIFRYLEKEQKPLRSNLSAADVHDASPVNRIEWGAKAGSDLSNLAAQGDVVAVYLRARRGIHHQKVAGPRKLDWEPGNLRPTTDTASQLLQFLVNKRTDQALAAEEREATAAERIRGWFARFEEHLRRLTDDPELAVEFDRRAFNFRFRNRDGYSFDLNTLADGHAAALAILAELLIRVDVIRDARRDDAFEPEGVVIVDEIETHLHLSLQEQILPFLTELFPRFQFLVATHSPAVIASIPNAVVYDLKKREPILSDHFRGIRYGRLMTEHFGISSEIDLDSTEKLVRLRALAGQASRTPEEERECSDLAALLTTRSPALSVEVWMAKERLSYEPPLASGEKR